MVVSTTRSAGKGSASSGDVPPRWFVKTHQASSIWTCFEEAFVCKDRWPSGLPSVNNGLRFGLFNSPPKCVAHQETSESEWILPRGCKWCEDEDNDCPLSKKRFRLVTEQGNFTWSVVENAQLPSTKTHHSASRSISAEKIARWREKHSVQRSLRLSQSSSSSQPTPSNRSRFENSSSTDALCDSSKQLEGPSEILSKDHYDRKKDLEKRVLALQSSLDRSEIRAAEYERLYKEENAKNIDSLKDNSRLVGEKQALLMSTLKLEEERDRVNERYQAAASVLREYQRAEKEEKEMQDQERAANQTAMDLAERRAVLLRDIKDVVYLRRQAEEKQRGLEMLERAVEEEAKNLDGQRQERKRKMELGEVEKRARLDAIMALDLEPKK